MVLLVALHTLNVSVDTDLITANAIMPHGEVFDDIDSISEFLLETFFNDANLTTEGFNDNHHRNTVNTRSASVILFCTAFPAIVASPVHCQETPFKYYTGDTKINFDDHSTSLLIPPDQFRAS